MGVRLYLPNVRLSYPHLAAPHLAPGATEPKYGVALHIPTNAPAFPGNQLPGNTLLEQLFAARQKVIVEDMKGVAPGSPQKEMPCYPGAQKFPGDAAYANLYIINASAKTRPHIVDQNVQPVMNIEEVFYPGCYVNASISVYHYSVAGKGIAIGLDGVQFFRDGERLDNRPTAQQLFGAVAGAPPALAPSFTPGVASPQAGSPFTGVQPPFNVLS